MAAIKELFTILVCVSSCLLPIVLQGCVSLPQRTGILAVVDGEPVTTGDLEYLLSIAHRREDLSSAPPLSISGYLQKIIDEKLIIQEAGRMGLEKDRDIRNKVDAYLLRESVMRLYKEEIEAKLAISEEEITHNYKNDYEQIILGIIEVNSEEEALSVLQRLQNGEDFSGLALKYSQHVSGKDGGVVSYIRKALGPFWEKAVAAMKPGDLSDIRKSADKFYIIKFIGRKEAPDSEFEPARKEITAGLRRNKTKDRSDEYLRYLRKQADLKLDQELLNAIKFTGGKEAWLKDGRPLAETKGLILTAGEFTALLTSDEDRTKEAVLNKWLDKELVDREALSRHYEINTELKDMVRRYQEQLIKNTFLANTLARQINISDIELKGYYETHMDEFIRPFQYRTQQITVKTREEALDVLDSLNRGASFSWVAKAKSIEPSAPSGGNTGWQLKDQLPAPAGEIIDAMKPGDISPVLEIDSMFKIIRLIEKSEKATEEFEKVLSGIHKKLYSKKFSELFSSYIKTLKTATEITVYDDAVRAFEMQFRGKSHGTEKN